jgi:tRNA threonylcarbamoyladenosine biosynthesis protein TsaE
MSDPVRDAAGAAAPASELWVSRSAGETERAGEIFAAALREGDVVALVGPLGAGKTRLVYGIARGVAWRGAVRSPTFTLVNEYEGRLRIFHADLYRIEPEEVAGLAFEELAERGTLIVEWGEKLGARWLSEALTITIELGDGDERRLCASARGGARALALLDAWRLATLAVPGGRA